MLQDQVSEIDVFTTVEQCKTKIDEFKNLLVQNDYRGRKVAVELANVLIAKNILTLNDLPVFAEYSENEELANDFRDVVNYALVKMEAIKEV